MVKGLVDFKQRNSSYFLLKFMQFHHATLEKSLACAAPAGRVLPARKF
jgi:hypothetical protein